MVGRWFQIDHTQVNRLLIQPQKEHQHQFIDLPNHIKPFTSKPNNSIKQI